MTGGGGHLLLDCEDTAWFRDQPEAARGAAAALGRRIGLGETRTAELVLAVAELATNVAKHTRDGSILLRVLRNRDVAGVEVLVTDSGPGMTDVPAALRDGTSTAGTLGIGLGAVLRLSDRFDIHSVPGLGTVQLARFWPRPLPSSVTGEPLVGGITRPISGEDVCGDAWAARTHSIDAGSGAARIGEDTGTRRALTPAPTLDWSALTAASATGSALRASPTRPDGSFRPTVVERPAGTTGTASGPEPGVLVMACDGLGHGPLAANASRAAVDAFRAGPGHTPQQVMGDVHRALRGTRGAAVAIARLEAGGRVEFCGIGNITAAVVSADKRATLLSHPGIVGHQTRTLRTYEHRIPPGGVLVMHSDGLSDRWKAADLASLLHHPPALIAAALLRQAATRRDDAGIVVAKGRP